MPQPKQISKQLSVSSPRDRGVSAMPDRRLASMFTKRSKTAPVTATSVGMLSTYSPTVCGLANFTASLREGLLADRADMVIGVVRVSPTGEPSVSPEVVHELATDTGADDHAAARELNKYDVVVIQHEFGIYGGPAGEQVLRILEWVCVPIVVVTHTVSSHPTPSERAILERLTDSADAVVAMSEIGRQRLQEQYRVAPRKLMLIPHGAPAVDSREAMVAGMVRDRRPTVLTWGLLGPGKGIEWAIDAMPGLRGLRPLPRYVVAGRTHPKVLAKDGEYYRESLVNQAQRLRVSHMVEFEDGYLSPDRLRQLIAQADVVLLPYDSEDQVTSGVLVEALAARRPVISTSFPHARELLTGEHGGLLVPHGNPGEITDAIARVFSEQGLATRLVEQSSDIATTLGWPVVATQYRQLFDALLRRPGVVAK